MTFTTCNKDIIMLVNFIHKSVFVGYTVTLLVCFSRFLIALFTRLTYSSRLSFLFSPKSATGEIEISSSSSLLKRAFILLKRSDVNSFERIRITVSIIFSLIQTKIYNSIENTSLMNSEGFNPSEALTNNKLESDD